MQEMMFNMWFEASNIEQVYDGTIEVARYCYYVKRTKSIIQMMINDLIEKGVLEPCLISVPKYLQ